MTARLRAYALTFSGFGRDARIYLVTTLVFGAAMSLYWVDFNLYLNALGVDNGTIGNLMAIGQIAGVLASFPASGLSDRFGRRAVLVGGAILTVAAQFAYIGGTLPLIVLGVIAFGAGGQSIYVVQVPFVTEKTKPEHRNEYFAALFAIGNMTNLAAAIVGGAVAGSLASAFGLDAVIGPFQVLLVAMIVLSLLALLTVFMLTDSRPVRDAAAARGRFGVTIVHRRTFFRLLLPGFLTSLGAGQLIPDLNLFIEGKFHLDLPAINFVFAVTSLGTAVAVMIQPGLARRFGRIGSIVLVQGASIPFLLVLGFSPVLWSVIAALAVRNSLMNAGGPIFDAFAMSKITAAERATLAAAMSMLWALGWAIGGPYYGLLQDRLGFDGGYAVDFVTIIVLYTAATWLTWHWFRQDDAVAVRDGTILDGTARTSEGSIEAA